MVQLTGRFSFLPVSCGAAVTAAALSIIAVAAVNTLSITAAAAVEHNRRGVADAGCPLSCAPASLQCAAAAVARRAVGIGCRAAAAAAAAFCGAGKVDEAIVPTFRRAAAPSFRCRQRQRSCRDKARAGFARQWQRCSSCQSIPQLCSGRP